MTPAADLDSFVEYVAVARDSRDHNLRSVLPRDDECPAVEDHVADRRRHRLGIERIAIRENRMIACKGEEADAAVAGDAIGANRRIERRHFV